MARPTNEERLSEVHHRARLQFDRIQASCRDERKQCLADRRFYSIAGAQWEGSLGDQFENKPKFEVNKVHLGVMRIINEYRNNRITVDYVSKEGNEHDALADTCDGLYRADEQDSGAEEAYDNAFEEGVGGGFGAWRLRADYQDEEDEEDERQRIKFEPIYDADSSVFFDVDSKRQDKADAKHCYVLAALSTEGYKETWGDDPTSWPKEIQSVEFDWSTPDVVYVAEYYEVEFAKKTIHVFRMPNDEEERYTDEELEDGVLDEILVRGGEEVRTKKVKTKRIHKYIMSGGKVLEDCGVIAGKCIPIIPFYGKRWFVDNVERCMGHVRLSRDAQRLKNMQLSKLGEIAALSTVEKPILLPEQIAGHQMMWSEDNIKNYPYLLINGISDKDGNMLPGGPVAYSRAPQIPPAMVALLQITETDMAEMLGNAQQAEKMVSGVSGKAVEMIQTRLDMQAFIYMSNFAKAMRRSGEVWLSQAKDVYVEKGRKMKMVGDRGSISTAELARPIMDPKTGAIVYENDMANAEFDVSVEVGPTSSSRRASTVRALTGMMAITSDPETQQVLQSMAMMNMEGEGIADVREFFRKKLVKAGVLKPTDEEAEAMAAVAGQKDPNTVFLEAAAEEASAKADRARMQVFETFENTNLKKAQTIETLAGVDHSAQDQAIKMLNELNSGNQAPASVPVGTEGM